MVSLFGSENFWISHLTCKFERWLKDGYFFFSNSGLVPHSIILSSIRNMTYKFERFLAKNGVVFENCVFPIYYEMCKCLVSLNECYTFFRKFQTLDAFYHFTLYQTCTLQFWEILKKKWRHLLTYKILNQSLFIIRMHRLTEWKVLCFVENSRFQKPQVMLPSIRNIPFKFKKF